MSILDAEKADGTTEATDELARLRAENEALKSKLERKSSHAEGIPVTVEWDGQEKTFTLSLKTSDKGCVSIYGTGRFPFSVYPLHLLAILGIGDQIKSFIEANAAKLSFEKK